MPGESGSETVSILHVDDDPDFAELSAELLEREKDHFAVEIALSAADGLEWIAAYDLDCIISDYDMPGLDGIEFLQTVRETNSDLPFILFTGRGSEEIASEAISSGVTDYLQKEPGLVQYEVLANRVENAVERYRARRRIALQKEQYQRLFEDAPVMYAVTRNEGGIPHIEECNQWFLDRLGYDRDEIIGEPATSFYTENSMEALLAGGGYARALDGEFLTEVREFITAEGEVLETLIRAVPRFDEDGNLVGTLALYVEYPTHGAEIEARGHTKEDRFL